MKLHGNIVLESFREIFKHIGIDIGERIMAYVCELDRGSVFVGIDKPIKPRVSLGSAPSLKFIGGLSLFLTPDSGGYTLGNILILFLAKLFLWSIV